MKKKDKQKEITHSVYVTICIYTYLEIFPLPGGFLDIRIRLLTKDICPIQAGPRIDPIPR